MTTHDNLAVAAGHSADPGRWRGIFDELMVGVGARFGRVEPRRRARAFVLGLLAGLPRVNCWSIAEHAGDATPAGMQHLLSRACWDADGVRDDIRGYMAEHLGDLGEMLVVDETGDLKKGSVSAGVQRQYTGTAGRVENCQVSYVLAVAKSHPVATAAGLVGLAAPPPAHRPGSRPMRAGPGYHKRGGTRNPPGGRVHGRGNLGG